MAWNVGDVLIECVREIDMRMNPSEFFPQFDPDKFSQHAQWLKPDFVDDAGNLIVSIQALVVKSCGKYIVVDTCMGNDRPLPAGLPTLQTNFLEKLERVVSRHEVDFVLCTHLHCDHVGWNTMLVDGNWVPTFPNASYLFARAEYAHWSGGKEDPFIDLEYAVRPIVNAGLHRIVDPGFKVTDEVSLVATPGHTPGHVSVLISSQGKEAWITGDVVHSPVQLAETDWSMISDSDPVEASKTRRHAADLLLKESKLIIGTHFPEPTAGYLAEVDGQIRFEGAVPSDRR